MRFSISIANREADRFSACFEDVVEALASALTLCGHQVVPQNSIYVDDSQRIVFGCNNGIVPKGAIIFNTEQVAISKGHLIQNLARFREHIVWDYSKANVAWFKANGVERAVLCPIGYAESMERSFMAVPQEQQDIDVLWYGSVTPRRAEILDALETSGLSVRRLAGVYGVERDLWIARSKLVLNLHAYERSVFEVFRCSHLWANRKAVVTESGSLDEELEDLARRTSFLVAERKHIVDMCKHLCWFPDKRHDVEERAYTEFKKIDFVENVRKAVDTSVWL